VIKAPQIGLSRRNTVRFRHFGVITGPAAEPATNAIDPKASDQDAKVAQPKSGSAEKQGANNGKAGSKTDDDEESADDSEDADEATADDGPDELQGPTEEEMNAAFPDPADVETPAAQSDGAGTDSGNTAVEAEQSTPDDNSGAAKFYMLFPTSGDGTLSRQVRGLVRS
jgi:hypothetical protein